MAEKPIRFTKHAVMKTISLGFTEEDVVKAINMGRKLREGRRKFKVGLRLKQGMLVATCSDYPDHILVITVGKGGEKKKW